MNLRGVMGTTFALSLASTTALAVVPVKEHADIGAHVDAYEGLDVLKGVEARHHRNVSWIVPATARPQWTRFTEAHGTEWRAQWDRESAVPLRIYGKGIKADGSMSSPAAAAQAAQSLLQEHLQLFAPGASPTDFEVVSNSISAGMRSVGFIQRVRGVEVIGGQFSVSFKNDRLFMIRSEALPHVAVEWTTQKISAEAASRIAQKWITDDFGSKTTVRDFPGRWILPIVRENATITYHDVIEVVVDAQDPVGRWSVYLARDTGEPVARRQTLMFQQSQTALLKYNRAIRYPGTTREDAIARFVTINVDGQASRTTTDGEIPLNGPSGTVQTSVVGPLVRVINDAGAEETVEFEVEAGGEFVWNRADIEAADAQLQTYVSVIIAKDYANDLNPQLRWLSQSMNASVNLDGNCNAFSDGTDIAFFGGGRRCENTGRISDVVYHEFGHSLHAHSIIRGVGSFDSALSEGLSDIFSALITGDPGMGRGFFYTNNALRHLDPPGEERIWPRDVGESHQTGTIIGGTFWDLRTSLISSLGDEAAKAQLETIYYAVMQRASDIPSSYAEALAADDDDGDLSNGTPNICDINEAFSRHGLADPTASGPGVSTPVLTDRTLSVPVNTNVECPGTNIETAVVDWRLKDDTSQSGSIPMNSLPASYEGLLPPQPAGSVMEYQIKITLMNGDNVQFPRNPSEPWYELYVGETVPLYCTDFETDPEFDGWQHSLVRGQDREGADDWQWGRPAGTEGSGDPSAAFSGNNVIGNDLGGDRFNGTYQPNKTNQMVSPRVNTMGHSQVRLQYRRWLNVENGFYDAGRILANGTEVWTNNDFGERGDTHHTDFEWRFHDVDLTSAINGDTVEVTFQLESDGGLEMGGWTIDDFCIVGIPEQAAPVCGDGNIDPGETCDDGNQIDDDACSNACTPNQTTAACGNGVLDAGEACDPGIDAANCSAQCTLLTTGMPGDLPMDDDGLTTVDAGSCGCSTTEQSTHESLSLVGLFALGALLILRRKRS